jgi:TRAP-type C4-dicarboxylate transport system permease small subunit
MGKTPPQFHFSTAVCTMLFAGVMIPVGFWFAKATTTGPSSTLEYSIAALYAFTLILSFGLAFESFIRYREKKRKDDA